MKLQSNPSEWACLNHGVLSLDNMVCSTSVCGCQAQYSAQRHSCQKITSLIAMSQKNDITFFTFTVPFQTGALHSRGCWLLPLELLMVHSHSVFSTFWDRDTTLHISSFPVLFGKGPAKKPCCSVLSSCWHLSLMPQAVQTLSQNLNTASEGSTRDGLVPYNYTI